VRDLPATIALFLRTLKGRSRGMKATSITVPLVTSQCFSSKAVADLIEQAAAKAEANDRIAKGELVTAVRLADARRVISAAERRPGKLGQPMNIAVADEGETSWRTFVWTSMDWQHDVSMKKAYTSRA